MLPLSLAMDDSEFDNGGDGDGGGGGGGRQRRPATAEGGVVAGAFDGGGSVAPFNGGNGLW